MEPGISEVPDVYWVSGFLNIEYLSGNISWKIPPGFYFIKNEHPDIPVWAAPMQNGWSGPHDEFLGIAAGHRVRIFNKPGLHFSRTYLVLPLWLAAVVTVILPGFAAVRYFRMRKLARQGVCAHCGYDLRATPDCCPECGTIPSKKEIISN
jgi:hypothetical protein